MIFHIAFNFKLALSRPLAVYYCTLNACSHLLKAAVIYISPPKSETFPRKRQTLDGEGQR